jgi:molybdenum cofactor cytidylyltransferase
MGQPKALLPFRQGTFLSTIAETLTEFCAPVIAVFGYQAESVQSNAPGGVIPVINDDYEAGMLTSLQAGLRSLDLAAARQVLFTLVDHPAVSRDTIASLLKSNATIAIPRYSGRRGHPVIVSAAIAREFLDEPATAKVRYLIDRHSAEIDYIDVPDAAINDDIDDPALYQSLLEREAAHQANRT